MRGLSNILAVLGLLAIAVVATVIGYVIISSYMAHTLKPSYDVSITYAKLIFVTDSENIQGKTYSTYVAEIGVSNPGPPQTLQVCIVSAKPSGTSYVPYTFADSCPTINVDSGYNVYSFIIRISNDDLEKVGCGSGQTCPISNSWQFAIYKNGIPVSIIKPVYVIP